jgi:hypothetical protein
LAIQTFSREDRYRRNWATGDNMIVRAANKDYFRAVQIPLMRGRLFNSEETRESLVAIVNQALVRYFANEEPIGKRIGGPWPEPQWKKIVDVVADEKNAGLRSNPRDAWLAIRTTGEPSTIAGLVRQELRTLDSHRPVTVRTISEQVGRLLARPRFQTLMMAIFRRWHWPGIYGVVSWMGGATDTGDWRAHGAGSSVPGWHASGGARDYGNADCRIDRGDRRCPGDDTYLESFYSAANERCGGSGYSRLRTDGVSRPR